MATLATPTKTGLTTIGFLGSPTLELTVDFNNPTVAGQTSSIGGEILRMARDAKAAGTHVHLFAIVGDDELGKSLTRQLRQEFNDVTAINCLRSTQITIKDTHFQFTPKPQFVHNINHDVRRKIAECQRIVTSDDAAELS